MDLDMELQMQPLEGVGPVGNQVSQIFSKGEIRHKKLKRYGNTQGYTSWGIFSLS